jgi:DNA-binding NarL/FixJ family response regulator
VHLLLDGQPWHARIGTIGSYLTRKGCSLPADPIKVLLADDHTMFREGFAGILASYGGMEVVGSTPNGEEAVTLVERTRPDVVLMQVQSPFERAKDFLARMRAVSPPPKVVIVTMFGSPRYLRELMNLGASAYLIKSASTQHLIGAMLPRSHRRRGLARAARSARLPRP